MPILLLDKLHEEPSVGGKGTVPADIEEKVLVRMLNLNQVLFELVELLMKRSSRINSEIVKRDFSAREVKLVYHRVAFGFVSYLSFRGSCILSLDLSDAMDQKPCIAEN